MFRLVRNPDPRKKPPYGSRLDPTHPLAQGLVGCWLFNEGGGNTTFDLVNNKKGILGSSASFSPNGIFIDGATTTPSDAVAVNDFDVSGAFSIITKAYSNTAAFNEGFCGGRNSSGEGGFDVKLDYTEQRIHADIGTENSWIDKTADIYLPLEAGHPYFVAYTISSTGYTAYGDDGYVNGESYSDIPHLTATQDNFYIGASYGSESINGEVYFMFIFERSLSEEEILYFYAEPYAPILVPQYWYMVDFGAAVTSSLVKIINEELQFNEATLKLQSTQKVVNETLQLSESVEKKGTTKKVINETLQISESTTKTSGMIKIISETLQIAESFAKISGITKVVNEALQLSESISRKIGITKIVNETLQLVEGIKKLSWTTKIVNETLRFNETLFKRGSTKKVINETLQISETTGRLTGITKIINETLQIAESLAKITGITKVVNETLQLSESVLQKTGITKIINETLQISEKIKKLSWTTKVVNETLQLSETLFKKVSIKKIINETLQLSENIARKSGLIKIINEVLNIGENIIRTLAIALGWREVVKGDSRITTMITGDSRITTMITGDSPLD